MLSLVSSSFPSAAAAAGGRSVLVGRSDGRSAALSSSESAKVVLELAPRRNCGALAARRTSNVLAVEELNELKEPLATQGMLGQQVGRVDVAVYLPKVYLACAHCLLYPQRVGV